MKSWDCCNDLGATSEEDKPIMAGDTAPLPMQFKAYGTYSEKIIAQAYFVEVQTVTRNAICAISDWGVCFGPGCSGGFFGSCPWQNEVYTAHGLSIVAQVGIFEGGSYPDGTDGVDPAGLPRNSLFEAAINGLYDILRSEENIPVDEIAGARFTKFQILKGYSTVQSFEE